MKYPRESHTASVLNDGKVLVVGGDDVSSQWNSAELYDLSTGVWNTTGNLTNTRYCHTAC